MIPMTPTPLPPGEAVVSLTDSYSLWGGVDTAIQVWNMAGPWAGIIQLMIIVGIVIVGVAVVLKAFRQTTERDSQI